MKQRSTISRVAAVAAIAGLLAACGGSDSNDSGTAAKSDTAASEDTAKSEDTAMSEDSAMSEDTAMSEDAPAGDDDNVVTIWSAIDQPVQDGLAETLSKKAEAEGITIEWEKVENINQLIMQRIQADDTPDIALIPQPGVVGDIKDRGASYPLDDVLDVATLKESMIPGTLEAGTFDGELHGLLVSMNVKSLVFYNKPAWEAAGYPIPKSIDELNALTDQMKTDGNTPWCMGIGSDAATGWPATDWFEDLIMRYGGVDGYNSWVTHETPFNSDLVKEAAAEFENLMFTEGNVLGGRQAIVSTAFGQAGLPMFDEAGPACWMLKQGSFITDGFPENIKADLTANVGVFGFPPATPDVNPVLGGGDLAVMLDNSESTKKAINWLSEVDAGDVAAGNGSTYISPHTTFEMSLYSSGMTQQVAGIAYESSAFLFDGSDQMPGKVGAGTFWTEITAWIAGSQDLDTTLTNIDNSWPAE